MKVNTKKESHSDFWLDEFEIGGSVPNDTTRLIRLSMARRAVSNFVNILTGKNIPVVFNEAQKNLTDGKTILLSANIESRKDFDHAVGLSLHEGSHVLLSDFRILQDIWQKVPREIYNIAEPKGFSKTDVVSYLKTIFNVIEDRYIDRYVYSNAPGYRGYYQELYKKLWHSDLITTMLKSSLYRSRTVESYETRIVNLTNPATDLNALPDLRKIAKIIDIKNIDRLKTTDDRLQTALDVIKVIYLNVDPVNDDIDDSSADGNEANESTAKSGDSSTELISQSDEKKSEQSETQNESSEPNKEDSSEVTSSNEQSPKNEESDDVDDILGGGSDSVDSVAPEKSKEKCKKENENSDVPKTKRESIDKIIEKQREFVNGDVRKKKVSRKENRILTQLEKAGVTIVNVGKLLIEGEPLTKGVDCVLVKNLTTDLVFSDQFPCKFFDKKKNPNKAMLDSVNKGIQMGSILGRRLKVRSEVNNTKYMRKSVGKIDRRVLAELGFDNENVFYRMDVDKYKKAFIHISLDASSSMAGKKWQETIMSVTAICKAASMIDNLRVSVSIRSTIASGIHTLPYVAMVYDSSKDSFLKVRTIFPFLSPYGTTPEGLCYEAIMDMLDNKSNEEDYYFLNFSDGEPCFVYKDDTAKVSYSYDQVTGAKHTRRQVNEIRNRGYKVVSYFIKSEYMNHTYNSSHESCFKTMYGQDAKFIDVTNIIKVANTLNQMFLQKAQKV